MKQLKTIFAAATLLFATSSFATKGPEKVSSAVKTQFEKSFTAASNVKWEKTSDFYFASFVLDSKESSAAYNENGELVGLSRSIDATDLPQNVSLAIGEKYEGYTVDKKVTELTYEGQTSYYVNVWNSKQLLRLKCSGSGNIISVVEKTKK